MSLPKTEEELRASDLFRQRWYYSTELLPGLVAEGVYPPELPMLPRLMLRQCDLTGTSCLDMGTMEGLIPTLMCRGGATDVLAVDATDHCLDRLIAVGEYHDVDFSYESVGLMYNLSGRLPGRSFDVINCSGLLYHVFSPLMVLAGMRALLKRDGLLIVSTNVLADPGFHMEFNHKGRLQVETNTFWYLSVPLLDYLLRYLRLAPIDALYLPHEQIDSDVDYVLDKPSGYLSVVCRAIDEPLRTEDDSWITESAKNSWESLGGIDWGRVDSSERSEVNYRKPLDPRFARPDGRSIDLWETVQHGSPAKAQSKQDTHLLMLSDRS